MSGWDEDRPSKGTPARDDSGRLGRTEIVREDREEPVTGTAIPLAKGDMQVKHNYKTPGLMAGLLFGLERLDHDEEHDCNHRQRRELVDEPEKPRRMHVAIRVEGISPARERQVKCAQRHDEKKLCPDPPHPPIDEARGARKHQAKHPSRDHRRRHNPPLEAAFHDFEGCRPVRAWRCHRVVNKEPRQVEQPRHPGNHADDVK